MAVLRRWLQAPEYGNFSFTGLEGQIWDEDRVDDFVSMKALNADHDLFSGWFADWIVKHFHQYIGYRYKVKPPISCTTVLPLAKRGIKKPISADDSIGLTEYKESKITFAASIIVISVAAMLPAISIFALYLVHSMVVRLGVITVFSGLFSASLAVFTRARKVEVFAATAALAFGIYFLR